MKLSLEALKERAEATSSNELLESISGGTENSCHNNIPLTGHLQIDTKNIPVPTPPVANPGRFQ